ncbi:MAG: hypothetical protein KKG09_06325 [Verrucomicrobia bacterium]|nr:hypothetical protein [Verrucomicrobiota bacterium]MCG2679919.1 hypothetical protein [Kiritimatiellia bacterium]MBU4247263.1 hypothetical protein [Verrucomicrobiota bacterium]MBU4290544.1 hypothetical protein [Verrucomicrobiota bacterium]MBU4428504.1 hypothetical protein [Verrucomicrobiota bacterium]
MRFIKFGLTMLQLRLFSGMDAMSVVDDLAVCVFYHSPVFVRVNSARRPGRPLRDGERPGIDRGGSARHYCN